MKEIQPEDHVYANMLVLLEDFYAFIVQESNSTSFQMVPSLYQRISEHSSFGSLMMAVAHDESLAKFFPALRDKTADELDASSIRDLQAIIVWSDASSEGMTPLTLCAAIISDVFRYLWSWRDNPSLDDALNRLPDSIQLARNLARKRSVKIPAVVSIHNLELIGGRTIQIGNAILRKPIRYDRFRLIAITGAQDANTLVLRFETSFSAIHIRAANRDASSDEEQQKTQRLMETVGHKSMERRMRQIQDEVNRARLAIVLASPPDRIFSPVQGWNSAVNPLSDLNRSQISNARSLGVPYPYPTQRIGRGAERKIGRLASLIGQYPDVLKAGIRRLLLAITERMYPEDGFVDAIICWENLFSGTPETTLRVCGAMAKLLSPANSDRRQNLYKDLSTLYMMRNKFVHGSETEIPEKVYENRDSAIRYAISALKVIYARGDLLEIKDSNIRGRTVLMGR
jgi:hypothetical protein